MYVIYTNDQKMFVAKTKSNKIFLRPLLRETLKSN